MSILMKRQYFTDQRDYFKYSILRHLQAEDVACTVCWMLTADDDGQAGQMRDYLEDPANWRNLDSAVFDFLHAQMQTGQPDIHSTEHAGSPIAGCVFHWNPFPAQLDQRPAYFHNCIHAAQGTRLVFVDPDTGPTPASRPRPRLMDRYITPREIAHIYEHGFSVLVFQFLSRIASQRANHLTNTRNRLQQATPEAAYHVLRSEDLAFHFVLRPEHDQQIQAAIDRIIADWRGPLLRRPP